MKKIIFLAILSMLILQGCNTTPGSSKAAAAAPAAPVAPVAVAVVPPPPPEMDPMKIMTNPNVGNCTACHAIISEPTIAAGDIGPPFFDMKNRFPDIEKLKANIADQKAFASETIMPPFGRNKLLTPEQIDVVTKHIYNKY